MFLGLHEYISSYTLKEVLKHVESFKSDTHRTTPPCINSFSRTMGLPCAHLYNDRRSIGITLLVRDFYPQWRLDRTREFAPIDPILLLKDPLKVRSRLTVTNSGGRELSRFEHIDIALSSTLPKASQPRSRTARSLISRARYSPIPAERTPSSPPPPPYPPIRKLREISMGDHIVRGGFKITLSFIPWTVVGKKPSEWAQSRANDKLYAPDSHALRHPIVEDHC